MSELLDQLDQSAQSFHDEETHSTFAWKQLEDFQAALYRAMALDPTAGAPVPVSQVPAELFAAELNQDLNHRMEELRKSTVADNFHAKAEFSRYLDVAQKIIDHRRYRQFPQARAIAKRGYLEATYHALTHKVSEASKMVHAPSSDIEAKATHLQSLVQSLKAQVVQPTKGTQKKDVFGNGNQFVWYALIAMMGFLLGIAGYRMHPDFFQKILDHTQTMGPIAVQASGVEKLDYARWLKELEEILSRLKSSQLTHERRIEDVVQNSEKITHQAMALYSDARIKSEANLEFRMSSLLREIQSQCEQGKRLQSSDRIQINLMLEHCLRLCDAIETNSIHFDHAQMADLQPRQAV